MIYQAFYPGTRITLSGCCEWMMLRKDRVALHRRLSSEMKNGIIQANKTEMQAVWSKLRRLKMLIKEIIKEIQKSGKPFFFYLILFFFLLWVSICASLVQSHRPAKISSKAWVSLRQHFKLWLVLALFSFRKFLKRLRVVHKSHDGNCKTQRLTLNKPSEGSNPFFTTSSKNSLKTPSWSMPASDKPCTNTHQTQWKNY